MRPEEKYVSFYIHSQTLGSSRNFLKALQSSVMLLNNVLVFLFFRSDFCPQNTQFSSGRFSVSASDSRAALQMLQSER